MAELYPLLLSLIVLFGYVVAAFLAVYSVLPGHPGLRWHRISVVPGVAAFGTLGMLLVAFRQPSADLAYRLFRGGFAAGPWRLSPWAGRAVVGLVVLAAITAVYVTAHALPQEVARMKRWRRGRNRAVLMDVARTILVGTLAIVIAGSTVVAQRIVAAGRQRSATARIVFTHSLPGAPTGLALRGRTGFITFGEGDLARIELSADGSEMTVETVVDGLTFPRGPVMVGDELLIVDLGALTCADAFPQCWTAEPSEELARIEASGARVLAFAVSSDGRLGPPREVLVDLPVVNTEHAPSSQTLGPDGYIYLPIGGPDRLPRAPDLLADLDHPHAELLGSLVRFSPDADDVEVIATGLRNVFKVVFAPDGHMLGVDNGGEAARGWRLEQLIDIEAGSDYGYPLSGTFNDGSPAPIWILNARGSAGIAWTDAGETSGVVIGSFGKLSFVPLQSDADGLYVPSSQLVRDVIADLDGFVTAIEVLAGDRLAVSVLDPTGTHNALHVIELSRSGG